MTQPNIFRRLLLCLVIFFRFLFDGRFAGYVLAGWSPEALAKLTAPPAPKAVLAPVEKPAPAPKPAPVAPPARVEHDSSAALHLLAILQREGRLVDFLQEDISGYEDADVGAAARLVHDGCRKGLGDYLVLEPLRSEGEGAPIVIERGFDPGAVRLTGNVTGEPPFKGSLRHHGWRVAEVNLPATPRGQDPHVIAPAEVEL